MAFSYPLQIHPCRNSLRQLLFGSNGFQGPDGRWVAGEGGHVALCALGWAAGGIVGLLCVIVVLIEHSKQSAVGWF